jgi:hypothetical protein
MNRGRKGERSVGSDKPEQTRALVAAASTTTTTHARAVTTTVASPTTTTTVITSDSTTQTTAASEVVTSSTQSSTSTEPPTTEPAALKLEIISLTSPVSPNTEATLVAKTLPGADCTISVRYKTGPSKA